MQVSVCVSEDGERVVAWNKANIREGRDGRKLVGREATSDIIAAGAIISPCSNEAPLRGLLE